MVKVKRCTSCKQPKPLTVKFFYHRAGAPHLWQSTCKQCLGLSNSSYYARVRSTAWFKKKARAWARKGYLRRQYDVSLVEFVNQWKRQGGRCAICRRKFSGKQNPHIDHCHKTQVWRGILCRFCNIALGLFRDDVVTLRRAIKYLLTSRRRERSLISRPTGEHSNRLPDFRGGK
jgi:Recombination endonuclease VII